MSCEKFENYLGFLLYLFEFPKARKPFRFPMEYFGNRKVFSDTSSDTQSTFTVVSETEKVFSDTSSDTQSTFTEVSVPENTFTVFEGTYSVSDSSKKVF